MYDIELNNSYTIIQIKIRRNPKEKQWGSEINPPEKLQLGQWSLFHN